MRPWALAAPILVLVLSLPLLRPLRVPDAADISSNELSRLAAVQSMAESHTQVINDSQFFQVLRSRDRSRPPETVKINRNFYSDKPPVMAAMLSWAYALMMHCGLTFQNNPALVTYLLTLLGATLPVAGAAGLIYRMGRLFDLARPLRTALAAIVVMGSGLISYAVVLNSNAPAAALVLCACGCIVHVLATKRPPHVGLWMTLSGFCAALAAVIDLGAGFFVIGMACVILAIRWRMRKRLVAILLYALGSLPPILLHASLTVPVTGDWRPPFLHTEFHHPTQHLIAATDAPPADAAEDDAQAAPSWIGTVWASLQKAVGALVGSRGILSHFPVLLVGMVGMAMVLRRHWPSTTKAMACVTLFGGLAVVVTYMVLRADWTQAMFGPRWFIVFLPLMLFWAGAWLRKQHHPATWATAGLLLLFSVGVSLLGMTDPFVAAGPGRYTAAAALRDLMRPPSHSVAEVLADRD